MTRGGAGRRARRRPAIAGQARTSSPPTRWPSSPTCIAGSNPTREALLARRAERQRGIEAGELPDFLPETADVRAGDWQVAAAAAATCSTGASRSPGRPSRRCSSTRSTAARRVFMADLEDALSPDLGQRAWGPADAARRGATGELDFTSPEGKRYALNDRRPRRSLVRPRGWHLERAPRDRRRRARRRPACSTSGCYLFQRRPRGAGAGAGRASGPTTTCPSSSSHLEARLWNDVFVFGQEALGIPRGTIRATVLIETIWAAFEMDEILYELREHAAGLNAGRWDYIFSLIKAFRERPDMVLPDRAQVTMAVPFMRAYTQLLVRDLPSPRRARHRRHERVHPQPARAGGDGERAGQGARGQGARGGRRLRRHLGGPSRTWCRWRGEVFDASLGRPAEPEGAPGEDAVTAAARSPTSTSPAARSTEAGVRLNVSVALQYLDSLAARQRRGGHQRPDGGRGDRGDLPLAALAVAAPRGRRSTTEARSDATATARSGHGEELARGCGGREQGRLATAAALLDGLVLRRRVRRVPDARGVSPPRLIGAAPTGPRISPGGVPRSGPARGARRTTPSRTTSSPRRMTRRTRPWTSRPSKGVKSLE